MWQNSKTQNVAKLKYSKCDKTKKNSKYEGEKNSETQIVTKNKISNSDKAQKLKLKPNFIKKNYRAKSFWELDTLTTGEMF